MESSQSMTYLLSVPIQKSFHSSIPRLRMVVFALACVWSAAAWAAEASQSTLSWREEVHRDMDAPERYRQVSSVAMRRGVSPKALINVLPMTISTPGTYMLEGDLELDESQPLAVSIQSSDVTLDCQGKSLRLRVQNSGTTGVFVATGLNGVTIANCVIENFSIAIRGNTGGTGLEVINNDIRRSTAIGIYVGGDDTLIAGNRVVAMKYLPGEAVTTGVGIMLSSFDATSDRPSTGAVIQGNVIAGIAGREQAMGIYVIGSRGAKLLGNKILDLSVVEPGAMVYGIYLRASYRWPKPPGQDVLTTETILRDNEVMIRQHPLNTFAYATDGIALDAVECQRNTSIGFAVPAFGGCLQAGGNIGISMLYAQRVHGSGPLVPGPSGLPDPSHVSSPAAVALPLQSVGRTRSSRQADSPLHHPPARRNVVR
jgi:hypothetical protein